MGKKKMSAIDFKKFKQEGKIFTMVTAYDYTTASIVDMALNYVDGKLYAMDDNNTIYTVDFMTGALTQVATITIVNPKGSTGNYLKLRALAIDNDGTFYSINDGSTTSTYLYKWTLDNVVEGKIENLAAANPDVTVGVWSKYLWHGIMITTSCTLPAATAPILLLTPTTSFGL